MAFRVLCAVVLVAPTIVLFPGCGPGTGDEHGVPLVAVKGKVTYKGSPLTRGIIEFEPQTAGRLARGNIQADGSFVLTTYKDGDGVAAGLHRVCVHGTGGDGKKEIVPQKYTQATSSGKDVEVSAETSELAIDFK
jgi:hypothetical protein